MQKPRALEDCLYLRHGVKVVRPGSYRDRKSGGPEWGTPVTTIQMAPLLYLMLRVLDDLRTRFSLDLRSRPFFLLSRCPDKFGVLAYARQSGVRVMSVSQYLVRAGYRSTEVKQMAEHSVANDKYHQLVANRSLLRGLRVSPSKIRAYQDAVIRHEIGHLLADPKDEARMATLLENEGIKQALAIRASKYAVESGDEALAEIFATITCPTYCKGYLSEEMEACVYRMLGVSHG